MENNEENASPIKLAKEKQTPTLSAFNCLICGKNAKKGTLRNPKEQGLKSFINALVIRGYCNKYQVSDFEDFIDFQSKSWKKGVSDVHWHPECYGSYTSRQNLSKSRKEDIVGEEQATYSGTRSQNQSINFKTQCFFCGFKKKNQSKKLSRLELDDVLKSIQNQCEAKNDIEFKLKIGGDFSKLPVYEARYHPSCYKLYMKPIERTPKIESSHDVAFSKLLEYMDPVIESGRALSLKTLLSHFKDNLRDSDYQGYESYTTQKLKAKLLKHYGNKVKITDEGNDTQSVFSSDVSMADAINCAVKFKQLTKNLEIFSTPENEGRDKRMVERAGQIIKADIADVRGINIHPLDQEDITDKKVKELIPASLLNLLEEICGDSSKIKSIAQDIISAATNGKKRMPKNVGLGVSLKNSLRSKEYITHMSKLGHSVSYDDVQRIETSWTSSVLESGDGYATLPSNTVKNVFTQAASDNGDYCQENDSQNVTNTVVYQHGEIRGKMNTSGLRKLAKIRRSIDIPQEPLEEATFSLEPELPKNYGTVKENLFKDVVNWSASRERSQLINEAWVIARIEGSKMFTITEIQDVPTWTGFRKIVSLKLSTPTTIGNCRSLPASPTTVDVVYNMLINVEKILLNLGQTDPCVTVDELVYKLAKIVQWNMPHLQNITIRLGGFHRAKNFTGVIGKRMRSSGFDDILKRDNIYGPNKVEGKFLCY